LTDIKLKFNFTLYYFFKIRNMKKIFSFLSLMIMISPGLLAGTKYYRLSYRDDPSTTVVIGWSDDIISTSPMVYYGTSDFGTNWASYPMSHGVDRSNTYDLLTNNFAELTGLTPNTRYYFVIKDGEGTSARFSFKTITDNPDDGVSFIAGGDSRTNIPLYESCTDGDCRLQRQNANKLVAKIRPDFVAFSGDFVLSNYLGMGSIYYANWLSDWQLAIGPDADGGLIVPLIGAFGNHELNDDIYELFDIESSNNYYALTFGGNLFRFYTLKVIEGESVCLDTTQVNWFTNDLQNYTNTSSQTYWKFAQYHVPMAPHAQTTTPNQDMIDCWANLFQPYGVKLVFEGHSHVLKYTWPIVPSGATGSDHGFIRDDVNGTVFMGEGCWGAPLRSLYTFYGPDGAYNWTRNQAACDGFHVVCVSKSKIDVQTVRLNIYSTVGQVAPNDPVCTLPSGLSIWTPSNGAIVEILNPNVNIIEEQNKIKKIDVFPVPAKNVVSLTVNEKINNATIELFDGMGKLIKTEHADIADTYHLDIKGLRAGAYFVFIKAGAYSESHKIIVE